MPLSPIVVGSASTFRFRVSSLIRGGTRLHLLKTMTMIRGGFKCESQLKNVRPLSALRFVALLMVSQQGGDPLPMIIKVA